MRRLQVDLNRRDAVGRTPATYYGPLPAQGEHVIAFEPEDGVRVDAVIVAVEPERHRVVLEMDWNSIRDDSIGVWSQVASPTSRGGQNSGSQRGWQTVVNVSLRAAAG